MAPSGARKILVALADTHGGHKLGLLNPAVEVYDEDEHGNLVPRKPELTATQEYLWDCYQEDIDSSIALAAGDPVVVIHNGDLTHGMKYPQQLMSTRKADQILIAVDNLVPWFRHENVTAMRLATGTGSHVFEEGSSTILVAAQLKAHYPAVDTEVVGHGLADVSGVSVDYAHHGPSPGIRNWTRGNVARYYLRSLMLDEILHRREPPRLVLRAHYHEPVHETVRIDGSGGWDAHLRTWESDIVVLPSYCGLSDFSRKATRSTHVITNGLVAFEIIGGELVTVYPFCRSVDLRRREKL